MFTTLLLIFHIFHILPLTTSCTTVIVSSQASNNNGAMCSHSNDGDGDVAGTLRNVPAANWLNHSQRKVSNGEIPQISHTYQYKTEGYSVMNEHHVGLCESTCKGIFDANTGWGNKGLLNIVDLSQLALERSTTAKEAVQIMGNLATTFGYHDAAESMFVVDPDDAWIFHILPDDTNTSAIWIAQQLKDSEISTVANAFVIRNIQFPLDGSDPSNRFLGSANLKPIAIKYNWWKKTDHAFDFSKIYSLGELGSKYNSGRRMWESYRILAPNTKLSPTYNHFNTDIPYPTVVAVTPNSISPTLIMTVMRSYFSDTIYDLTGGTNGTLNSALAAGSHGNPFRAHANPETNILFPNGRFERPIATWKTQVSYIVTPKNGVIWFAPHSALTSVYIPFLVEMSITSSIAGPVSINQVNHSTAFWANRYVYHLSQLNFQHAYKDIEKTRTPLELQSWVLINKIASSSSISNAIATQLLNKNANDIISKWWNLSELLLIKYAEGNCNGCQEVPRHLGYPSWWLLDVGYAHPLPTDAVAPSVVSPIYVPGCQDKVYGECGTKIVPGKTILCCNEMKCAPAQKGAPSVCLPATKPEIRTTVLITGCAGRTGSTLYKQLKRIGSINVRGLVRNITKARQRLGCNKCDASEGIYVGDVTKINTLTDAFTNVDTVIILTGSYPIQLSNGSYVYPKGGTPRDVDYLGSNNQVKTSVSVKTVSNIILVSSMGTTTPGSFLDLLGNGYSLDYKLNSEIYLMQTSIESMTSSTTIKYTIVKPSGLLPATGITNASYLIGHNDCLTCTTCFEITRSDLANVLVHAVVNSSLFENTRFDLSSDKKHVVVPGARDWNRLSEEAKDVMYPSSVVGCGV